MLSLIDFHKLFVFYNSYHYVYGHTMEYLQLFVSGLVWGHLAMSGFIKLICFHCYDSGNGY